MKNNFYLLFIALFMLCSCKDEQQTPDNLKKQMSDSWIFRLAWKVNYGADNKPIDSARTGAGIYRVEFKEDGTYAYTTVKGEKFNSGTYNVTSNTAFTIKDATGTYNGTVINLNFNTFDYSVGAAKVAGQPYSVTKYYFYR